jgi:hypothetical protein
MHVQVPRHIALGDVAHGATPECHTEWRLWLRQDRWLWLEPVVAPRQELVGQTVATGADDNRHERQLPWGVLGFRRCS